VREGFFQRAPIEMQVAMASVRDVSTVLAGYRNHPVHLRGSQHVPPRTEAVADAMNELFDLLEAERTHQSALC
jgi:hypothetical protein